MVRLIGKLGDRMLGRLVPRVQAQAAVCGWESCGGTCLIKYCCTGSGVGWYCTSCEYTC